MGIRLILSLGPAIHINMIAQTLVITLLILAHSVPSPHSPSPHHQPHEHFPFASFGAPPFGYTSRIAGPAMIFSSLVLVALRLSTTYTCPAIPAGSASIL